MRCSAFSFCWCYSASNVQLASHKRTAAPKYNETISIIPTLINLLITSSRQKNQLTRPQPFIMVSQCNFASPVKRFRDSKCVVVLNKIKGLLRCVTILATIGNRYCSSISWNSCISSGQPEALIYFVPPCVSLLILILLIFLQLLTF